MNRLNVINVPYEILLNLELNGTDLKVWGIISISQEGFRGRNEDLSEIARVSKNTISKSISKLERLGLIDINVEGTKRIIKIRPIDG